MPSEDTIRSFMYYRLQKRSDFPSWKQTKYYCNKARYNDKCSSDQTEYICVVGGDGFKVQGNSSGAVISDGSAELIWCNGVYKSMYSATSRVKLDENGYTNAFFGNFQDAQNFAKKDVLLDTDYYQKLRDEELKTLLQENSSSGSDTSVSVDMTTTNNLLWTIGLILCVILLLGFLRKIFNRGVK